MAALVWGAVEDRKYESGIQQGVLYPSSGPGVPWNGLISVNDGFLGGELESSYYDGVKYLDKIQSQAYKATLQAYSYPPEFRECLGIKILRPGIFITGQEKTKFGLSYKTNVNKDGYKLHLVYNAKAQATKRGHSTISNVTQPSQMEWEINAVPVILSGPTEYKPTAHVVIDSRIADQSNLATVEALLYGSSEYISNLIPQNVVFDLLGHTP